jgi:hypothetical protein
MAGLAPETGHPVNLPPTGRAVENELAESFLEIGFHLEELEPQELRLDRDPVGAVETGGEGLVDQGIGLGGLFGDRGDSSLQDVALLSCHEGPKLARVADETRDQVGEGVRRALELSLRDPGDLRTTSTPAAERMPQS